MKIIVCVDDKMGMMFNHRRQSRDIEVIRDMEDYLNGRPLWIKQYSEKIFEESSAMLHLDEELFTNAKEEDICFVEDENPGCFAERINEIILYRWNRLYPSDLRMKMDLTGWKLNEVKEFTGKSHKKITREIYTKEVE